MHFADSDNGRPFAKDPAVVFFNNRYWLYYSLSPKQDGSIKGFAIGVATSSDLENWSKVGEILPAAPYEANGVCAPGAIILPNGPQNGPRVHLFYQTYGNWAKDAICHAWSDDGLNFTRNPTNPIFSPHGSWNVGRAIDADVIAHRGQLYLFFATRDPAMKIQMLGVASAALTSGFVREAWSQRCDASILRPELPWEQECIEAPALCTHGGRFFLFYGGAYNNAPQQIGCAVSDDLLTWQRLSDHPVLPNGQPGTWNSSESGHPFAFTAPDGQIHLFYQGNNDMGKSWYLARATVDWVDGLLVIRK
jgi:predicted GH43/DUF377 family glycosyl hydrolase